MWYFIVVSPHTNISVPFSLGKFMFQSSVGVITDLEIFTEYVLNDVWVNIDIQCMLLYLVVMVHFLVFYLCHIYQVFIGYMCYYYLLNSNDLHTDRHQLSFFFFAVCLGHSSQRSHSVDECREVWSWAQRWPFREDVSLQTESSHSQLSVGCSRWKTWEQVSETF